jgi:hypothetical protein
MAWNPSPEVAVARDAAQKLGNADQIVIIAINNLSGQMMAVTYGETKELCAEAKRFGEKAYAAVHKAIENS